MTFEAPKLTIIRFDMKDILTASAPNWELPIVTDETDPEPTGWETPFYP